jgi:hypothetical protein
MCRAEQSQDLFSAEAKVGFQFDVSLNGAKAPDQGINLAAHIIRNDIDTSSGALLGLFRDIRLTDVVGIRIGEIRDSFQRAINENGQVLKAGIAAFPIPSAAMLYVPDADSVRWSVPSVKPNGAAPFSLTITRKTKLLESAACTIARCIRQSKQAGVLLINSCKFDE